MAVLDAYTMRARVYPALIGMTPVFALAAMFIPWQRLGWWYGGVAFGVGVLFCAFADLARRLGKRVEARLFPLTNGRPAMTFLRHRDPTFDTKTKDRYRNFLAERLGEQAPTPAQEEADPKGAEGFYERCGIWLRERTRDATKFRILKEENITYGARRNLYGMKWLVLALNAAVVIVSGVLLLQGSHGPLIYVVLGVALAHAAFFVFGITWETVVEASNQYARQLMLSCESFMADKAAKKEPGPKRSSKGSRGKMQDGP